MVDFAVLPERTALINVDMQNIEEINCAERPAR